MASSQDALESLANDSLSNSQGKDALANLSIANSQDGLDSYWTNLG